jgi:CTP synthase
VIPLVTTSFLYELPLTVHDAGLGDFVAERLGLQGASPDLSEWRALVNEIKRPKPTLRIAIVGKYIELQDAYLSVREALYHAGVACGRDVEIVWVSSEKMQRESECDCAALSGVSGVVVPGGFGYRGIEGKIAAARWARESRVPYLGLCLGMQVMVIELARHMLGSDAPNSSEFDLNTPHPVISLMPDQHNIADMGGTMRLGLYPCRLLPGTHAAAAYGLEQVEERHRHRFEFNNAYRTLLGQAGLVYSGMSPDDRLVEIAELADHPFMLGSQFHPEFRSRPNRPHPLFKAFIEAAIKRDESK